MVVLGNLPDPRQEGVQLAATVRHEAGDHRQEREVHLGVAATRDSLLCGAHSDDRSWPRRRHGSGGRRRV